MEMEIIIKLFLVLCCDTKTPDGVYSYQVRDLDKNIVGVLHTTVEYHENDTVFYKTRK
jgi:hypothetical protein